MRKHLRIVIASVRDLHILTFVLNLEANFVFLVKSRKIERRKILPFETLPK
jgi:hypothetical protein